MKLRADVFLAVVTLGAAASLTVVQSGDCQTWQTLAVFLLGVVFPHPRRLAKALRDASEDQDQDKGD